MNPVAMQWLELIGYSHSEALANTSNQAFAPGGEAATATALPHQFRTFLRPLSFLSLSFHYHLVISFSHIISSNIFHFLPSASSACQVALILARAAKLWRNEVSTQTLQQTWTLATLRCKTGPGHTRCGLSISGLWTSCAVGEPA